jgi:sugar O-acyltransferase (sialic acid O-acetyltransferase NeuD family)
LYAHRKCVRASSYNKMKKYYALIGAGGHGRETMPIFAEMIKREVGVDHSPLFVVEDAKIPASVNGYPVMRLQDYIDMPGERFFNVAIAHAQARARIAEVCISAGLKPISIISHLAYLQNYCEMGEGAMLSPFVAIMSNTQIGRFFHANIYARVAHDCRVGDYVTFAPNVQCNGHVHIEDDVYIGTSAIIKNGTYASPIHIGKGAVIGMGAVVTKNVPAFTTVVGNPANPLIKKS